MIRSTPISASPSDRRTVLEDRSPLSTASQGNSRLPHKEIVIRAVDTYFRCCHRQPLWLFDDNTDIANNRPDEIIAAVLALALRCDLSLQTVDGVQSPDAYADTARMVIMLAAANGSVSISTIQCLCLLSYYNYTVNALHLARLHHSIAQNLLQQSGLDSRCSWSTPTSEEIKHLFWSIHILGQICALPTKVLAISNTCRPTHIQCRDTAEEAAYSDPELPQESHSPHLSGIADIWLCSVQMIDVWKQAREYVFECAEGRNESPWSPFSTYVHMCSRLSDIECSLPKCYRYKNAKFLDRSKAEIQQDRLFWLAWINMQTTYHTIHAVLNHPFLYAQKASKHKRGPNMFWKNSSELALLHSVWITKLINMAREQDLHIYDPHIGQCAAIAATLHLHHSRTADEAFDAAALTNLDTCRSFLRQLEQAWPFSRQLGEQLDRLIEQSSWRDQERMRNRLSLNTSLMWAIVGYSPPSSYQSTYGLFHQSFPRAIAVLNEEDTALVRATYNRQAVELCRPARNVATSPTWDQYGTEQNEVQSDDDPLDPATCQGALFHELLLPWINDHYTPMDTDYGDFPHAFDLDGADFRGLDLGTL